MNLFSIKERKKKLVGDQCVLIEQMNMEPNDTENMAQFTCVMPAVNKNSAF